MTHSARKILPFSNLCALTKHGLCAHYVPFTILGGEK